MNKDTRSTITPSAYNTEDEIYFLNNVGTIQDKKYILKGYIKAAEKRVYWGRIKKDEVLYHARALLCACPV